VQHEKALVLEEKMTAWPTARIACRFSANIRCRTGPDTQSNDKVAELPRKKRMTQMTEMMLTMMAELFQYEA
jgi:hypothetical protein